LTKDVFSSTLIKIPNYESKFNLWLNRRMRFPVTLSIDITYMINLWPWNSRSFISYSPLNRCAFFDWLYLLSKTVWFLIFCYTTCFSLLRIAFLQAQSPTHSKTCKNMQNTDSFIATICPFSKIFLAQMIPINIC